MDKELGIERGGRERERERLIEIGANKVVLQAIPSNREGPGIWQLPSWLVLGSENI